MSETQNPVLPGWFSTGEQPHLLGTKCSACGTFYFPALESFCRNPACDSTQFESVALSRTGKLWSFTDAQYAPPEPYVASDPYEPFAIAAVELEHEKMIVLGQVVKGVGVEALRAGMEMEITVEAVPDSVEPQGKLVWKWKPLEAGQ